MSQPTPYTPNADFSQQEANNASGRSTVNTAALDAEFAAIESTLDQTLNNIQLLQRDDGRLKDVIVDVYTLAPDVLNLMGGFNLTGLWAAATDYAVNDIASSGAYTYLCRTAHTSGGSFVDTNWIQFGFTSGADAATAAAAAQVSASDALASENSAASSATSASASATTAASSATASATSAGASSASASAAATSATGASNSAAAAATSAASIDVSLLAPKASPALTGTPTAPTPATGTRSTAIATMQKFADEFGVSLSANGYQKLPSGLIVQWGVTGLIAAGGSQAITFPIAFGAAAYSVCMTPSYQTSSQSNPKANSFGTTGFSAVNSGVASDIFYWHAIGRA